MGLLVDSYKETTKGGKKKMHSKQTFMFSREKVCRNTFLHVYDIKKHFLHNITKKNTHGVTPCKHGNLGKKPSHSSAWTRFCDLYVFHILQHLEPVSSAYYNSHTNGRCMCYELTKWVLDTVSNEEKLEAARKMQEHITHAYFVSASMENQNN